MKPKTGRKPHEPTEASRNRVAMMMASGLSQEEVGAVLELSEPTLRRHYAREIKYGYAAITGRIGGRLIAKADNGDLDAMCFYLERRGGWNRRDNVDLGNADDKPLAIAFRWADATPTPDEHEQPPPADADP